MVIKFYGACREVTGSCILIEAGKQKILLECGFFQGSRLAEERNFQPLPFDPKTINALIICHAHLDHVGRIPKLFREGFRGEIFSTAPTKELAQLVLLDSYKLMSEDAQRDHTPLLFDTDDVSGTMNLFQLLEYDQSLEIFPNITLTLRNAGHILGSSLCELEADGKKLLYTSDIGNELSAILNPPEKISRADIVICESTYGGRVHEDISTREQKLGAAIDQTITQGGALMIPSFAIERTQELLHDIEHYCKNGNCIIPTFFLDSPLAEKATAVFEKYPQYLNNGLVNDHKNGDFFGLERLKITSTPEQSRGIDKMSGPKIIIAGSGMMNGGRILFHLQKYIEDPNNTLLIVGYQAKGTLGRRLFEGEKEVRIFGKTYSVEAKVKAIGSYSAHADSVQLLKWLSNISGVKKVFLTHGEIDESQALAKSIRAKLDIPVEIPQLGEEFVV